MRPLVIVAEGYSEAYYARDVLAPHLRAFDLCASSQVLLTAERPGHTGRGGVGKYAAIKTHIADALQDAETSQGYVTTMLDLYRLPQDFPGRDGAPSGDPRAKVEFLENALVDDFGDDPRLIPYIQLHEFEALVLANLPSLLGVVALQAGLNQGELDRDALRRFDELRTAIGEAGGPEGVDDGEETAPSKRIDRAGGALYTYQKVTDGVKAAAELDFGLMRERCPHFGAWVTRLEELGRGLGA